MSPEKQRIAIAEICGYSYIGKNRAGEDTWGHPEFLAIGFNLLGDKFGRYRLPDYLNSLDAMRQAEKMFSTLDMRERYASQLISIVFETVVEGVPATLAGCFLLAHATAAQRAEAFLKTLGKWVIE